MQQKFHSIFSLQLTLIGHYFCTSMKLFGCFRKHGRIPECERTPKNFRNLKTIIMMSFLSLPDVLCVEVMFEWCDVKGIGNLDSAVCNSEHRPGFLKNFCGNSINVSTGMNDHLMKWINSRSVKPTSFVVYKSCVFASWKDAIDWSEILDVTFLGRDKRPFQTTNLIEIVNKCEKLISIKLTKSKFFNGRVFSSFSDKLGFICRCAVDPFNRKVSRTSFSWHSYLQRR